MYQKKFFVTAPDADGVDGGMILMEAAADSSGMTLAIYHRDTIDADYEQMIEFAKWVLTCAKGAGY